MKIIIFLLVLILFSTASLHSSFTTTGDGSKDYPYLLYTRNDLIELSDLINLDYFKSRLDWWHKDKHFRLMQNIDGVTQAISWAAFEGHFQGSGHTITIAMNFDYNNNLSQYNAPALFTGLYGNGTIDSLTVEGFINNGYSGITYIVYDFGNVTNCKNHIAVSYGGIAGTNNNFISYCVNNGSVTGMDMAAGIAGDNRGQVISCINTGKITATNSGNNGIFSGVGGIAATSQGTNSISNSINIGTVSGQGFVGGIQGNFAGGIPSNPASITNCVNYGFVQGTNAVGGIVGNVFNSAVRITGCSNFGVVNGDNGFGCIVGINNGGTVTNNHYDKQMCGGK